MDIQKNNSNMKREVNRKKKLPSFAMDIGELEVLWKKLYSLFDTQDLHGSIHVEFPLEKIQFDNIGELKKYNGLPDKITSFSISVSDFRSPSGDRRVSVDSNSFSFFSENCMVYASAESEAWCAGVIETVSSHINSYKQWYSWFNSAPIGWFLFVFANTPIIIKQFFGAYTLNQAVKIGWLTSLITIGFLYIFKKKLFPIAILRIRNNESFIRKHSSELSLALALLSIIVTIFGWFVSKYFT